MLTLTDSNTVKPSKVKAGHIMAFVYYGKVKSVVGDSLNVEDLDSHNDFKVIGTPLIEKSFSADQFTEEEKVSKTKAAEILSTAYNRPLTVCFIKKDGDERVLRGRLIKPEPFLGRSSVEDLEATGDRIRLVDHRTIQYIVVDGVKYTVK